MVHLVHKSHWQARKVELAASCLLLLPPVGIVLQVLPGRSWQWSGLILSLSVVCCSSAWQCWCSLWLLLAFSVLCFEADKGRTRRRWKGSQHVFVIQPTAGCLFALPSSQTGAPNKDVWHWVCIIIPSRWLKTLEEVLLLIYDLFQWSWPTFIFWCQCKRNNTNLWLYLTPVSHLYLYKYIFRKSEIQKNT